MRLKDDSVNPGGMTVELLLGILVAKEVLEKESELRITSIRDGKHSNTSLHYSGNAVDLGIWGVRDPKAAAQKIKNKLNIHYDVVAEFDHIHLEFQPRQP